MTEPALAMNLDVSVVRVGRRRCPVCRRPRVLFRLTAFAENQPVGYGDSRCGPCAGLRGRRD